MAGTSSRIYKFCNRNPESCNYLGTNKNTTPLKKTEVEEYLISNNNSSGAPFSGFAGGSGIIIIRYKVA